VPSGRVERARRSGRSTCAPRAPRPVDREVAVATARLRALHPALRLPDALVLATAEVDDADVLTADRRWSAYSARVTVLG
jgi:PIN domain nuclease of toxin-antitoxin system